MGYIFSNPMNSKVTPGSCQESKLHTHLLDAIPLLLLTYSCFCRSSTRALLSTQLIHHQKRGQLEIRTTFLAYLASELELN